MAESFLVPAIIDWHPERDSLVVIAPRKVGKTTSLAHLAERLSTKYTVLYMTAGTMRAALLKRLRSFGVTVCNRKFEECQAVDEAFGSAEKPPVVLIDEYVYAMHRHGTDGELSTWGDSWLKGATTLPYIAVTTAANEGGTDALLIPAGAAVKIVE